MLLALFLLVGVEIIAQQESSRHKIVLKPDRVFDGEVMHEGWQVVINGNQIEWVGERARQEKGMEVIELRGCTLLPGLIEGHSHLFLHPYNETSWKSQVLDESRAERTARAVVHARNTLMAGFTTVRDLGTEGAMYDDAGLQAAILKGVVPGPRMLVATRAIVVTGSYGPKPGSADNAYPQGAAEVGNIPELGAEIRTEIGKGADLIKVYADYRWGPGNEAAPTFTEEELSYAVQLAASSGRYVVAHAGTAEGMRRAAEAGVRTIEHGDGGTPEVFALMKKKNIALCPTLAAGEAIAQYNGWKKGVDPEPERILRKKESFWWALEAGVPICFGGDVGVFPHGDNAREMELMVAYGMQPVQVLRSATSVNADFFGIAGKTGRIKPGLYADLVAVTGNPSVEIRDIRQTRLVMKDGIIYLKK